MTCPPPYGRAAFRRGRAGPQRPAGGARAGGHGRRVTVWDDKPEARARGDRARCRRALTWTALDALVLLARHPARAARAAPDRRGGAGRRRAGPVGCRVAVPRRARQLLARPLRRHHRHQRQVHHHGAAGAHPGGRRHARSPPAATWARGAGAAAAAGRRRVRAGDVQLHVGATRAHPFRCGGDAQPQPRPPGPPWRHGRLCRAKQAIFDRQAVGDIAVVGIDDAASRAMADELRAGPARVVTVSERGPADFAPAALCWRMPKARSSTWPAPPPCPARTMPRTPPPPPRWRAPGRPRAERWRAGMPSYPGLPHRQELVAQHRRHPLRQRQQGDQRRQRRARPGLLRPDHLDRRRHGQGRRHRAAGRILPAHRRGAADRPRRAHPGRDAARHGVAHRDRRHAGGGGGRGPDGGAAPTRRRRRWCCCRRPAPAGTSSPASTSAATAFRGAGRGPAWPRPDGARHDAARRAPTTRCWAAGGGRWTAGPWLRRRAGRASATS